MRASFAFFVAAALASGAFLGLQDIVQVLAYALGAGAAVSGLVILVRARAIRRIYELELRVKAQRNDISRSRLFEEHFDICVRTVRRVATEPTSSFEHVLQELLDSAAQCCAAVLPARIACYVIRTTHVHTVRWIAGAAEAYAPGNECSADRSLQDIAAGLGEDGHIVPMYIGTVLHRVVVTSDSAMTSGERLLFDHTCALIEIASRLPTLGSERSERHLRAM
ncbi:MAG: hypothetical protein JW940_21660 [Polyangiaceae bacterium]|nr:hypothetical protein [Polyangiaceae bacterium]